ncbi:uncharacterized protein LOC116852372 [Odontomachus brunneus]|uniref:uncharacterized protein LOC116852372 n=1 Tax=Odontomachus brunneus TaxID=486640 RepID=UPI0013F21529|nr:uncharacterized protein LOC116852372 [Odontomachus brunneus]
MIESARVEVTPGIKYLGLHLDGRWDFTSHFERLSPKLGRVAAALCSLLPNIGGPDNRVRRLYANTVTSIALYGPPVWAERTGAKRRIVQILHGAQRLMATRLVKAYRTVSHAAVTALAGMIPAELLARLYAETYNRVAELRRREGDHLVTARDVQRIRDSARRRALRRWQRSLGAPNMPGIRTIAAIRPCLLQWVGRAHGGLSYHMTQVLTGHGCFGRYLRRIGKERTAQFHHCAAGEDSAEHTLQECPAWAQERGVLTTVVGQDLRLPSIIPKMLESREAWEAVASFCRDVMSQKEAAERSTQSSADTDPTAAIKFVASFVAGRKRESLRSMLRARQVCARCATAVLLN